MKISENLLLIRTISLQFKIVESQIILEKVRRKLHIKVYHLQQSLCKNRKYLKPTLIVPNGKGW